MTIRTEIKPLGGNFFEPYDPGTIVFEKSIGGQYPIKVNGTGIYQITLVGGGAGGVGGRNGDWSIGCSGSSGGYSEYTIKLKRGDYIVNVGSGGLSRNTNDGYGNAGGNSNVSLNGEILAQATGAAASYVRTYQGSANEYRPGAVGQGNVKNGISGTGAVTGDCYTAGAASVYGGYGAGGYGNRYGGGNAVAGYVKITYKGLK